MRRAQPRSEQGGALVVALVMLTVIGLMVGAALTYASTSLSASNNAIRPNRASLYAADSAIQGAIEYIRDNPEMSSDVLSTTCIPGFYRYTDPKAGEVTVDACPQNDSLIYEGNFRAVLLTLGETATDGIHLGHNGDVDIGGHVWSNARIDLENPTHMVMKAGRVWAWGSCNRPGNIEMPPGVAAVCNASTKPEFASGKPKVALDPADPSLGHVDDWQPAEAAPASFIQPAFPVCTANSMTLQPGVYYDGDEFSANLNACDNVTLSPGVYYLNFPAGKDEWGLDNNVVGPACDAGGQGVQIVFADSAHIKLSGTLTLPCGRSATPTGPNIALYGLKSDIAGPGAQSYTLRPSGATTASTPAFAPLPATITTAATNYPQDGTTADVALPSAASASVVATGLDQTGYPGGIPLELRIAHQEDNNKATASALVKAGDGSTCTLALTRQQNMAIETKDVNCAGFNAVAPFEVTYSVQAGNQAVNGSLDGVELTAALPALTIKGQNGCVVKAPGAAGYCPLISPPSNGKGNMVVQAVVYIPQSTFAGKFNNTGNFKIGTALIARSVDTDINPNLDGTPVIGEDAARRTNGDVVFTARIGGQEWTSTQVVFPALPNNGIGDPAIKSWYINK